MAAHSSVLAWRIPGTAEPGGLPSMGSHRVGHDWSDLAAAAATHILEKAMATHSSVLAWRIPGMREPGGLPSMGPPRVGHDWSDLAAATHIYMTTGDNYADLSTTSKHSASFLLHPVILFLLPFKPSPRVSSSPALIQNTNCTQSQLLIYGSILIQENKLYFSV